MGWLQCCWIELKVTSIFSDNSVSVGRARPDPPRPRPSRRGLGLVTNQTYLSPTAGVRAESHLTCCQINDWLPFQASAVPVHCTGPKLIAASLPPLLYCFYFTAEPSLLHWYCFCLKNLFLFFNFQHAKLNLNSEEVRSQAKSGNAQRY